MANPEALCREVGVVELEERGEDLRPIEILHRGNISTQLVRCSDESEIYERFAGPISLVRGMMSEAEISPVSPVEISFRCHGLEFARSRLSAEPGKFRSAPELLFGAGPSERVLDDSNLEGVSRIDPQHRRGAACRWAKRMPLVAA